MAKRRKRSDAASSPNEPAQPAVNGNRDRIAARAYELYIARGGTHGADWEDWLAAEREFAKAGDSHKTED
jgi:hypothetical protein